MSILIPNRSDLTYYEMQLTLDLVAFDLVFRWNERDETWYMSIYDPNVAEQSDGSRTPIIGQIPILVGSLLLSTYSRRDRPLGDFLAIDTQGEDHDPGILDLGSRVVFLYFSNAELQAAAAARTANG